MCDRNVQRTRWVSLLELGLAAHVDVKGAVRKKLLGLFGSYGLDRHFSGSVTPSVVSDKPQSSHTITGERLVSLPDRAPTLRYRDFPPSMVGSESTHGSQFRTASVQCEPEWRLSGDLGPSQIRLVPLGGLGEVGLNCLALEQSDGILVIDCGAGFPDADLGVDVLHPDFSWLRERASRVHGIVLTHGHEDHIGGLPYLLAELEVPVWGPGHALALARRRLLEHDFAPEDLTFREVKAREQIRIGPFCVEPIRVAHSIVEASALCIDTAIGRVVHTGDFNFDPDPPDGEPTDEARLRALGDAGVALLLSDSTNIDVPERAGSERSVATTLEALVAEAPARVVIALFASNVQRLISIGELAQRLDRKICLLGRSLEAQVSIASQLSRLAWPSDLLVSAERAAELPRARVLALAGGTQAEKNSALRRLSLGSHSQLTLERGDTVILSSRVIPGNERAVITLINDLLRAGVTVRSRVTDPGVHTSGHAGRSEQRRMLELTRPHCFVPVHGTLHHLLGHQALARFLDVSNTLVVENGTPFVCDGERLFPEPPIAAGKVAVAFGGRAMTPAVLQARSDLSRYGVAFVSLVLDLKGALLAAPEVSVRGVPGVDGEVPKLRELASGVARAVASFRAGRGLEFEEFVRRATRRQLETLSGTRPLIELKISRI